MRIYISLPITGNEQSAREKAAIVKTSLSKQGHKPISPFDIYAGKDPTYDDYICYDLRAMLGCDAIYFCKGWEQSCGCNIEHDAALRYIAHGKKNFKITYE